MKPAAIAALAREAGLEDIADELAALTRSGFRLTYGEDAAALGASKLGGMPDLPTGVAWPTAARSTNPAHSMAFIAQIDLAGLDRTVWPGPADGLLSFFCAPEVDGPDKFDEWGPPWVLRLPAGSALQRREQPADLASEYVLGEVGIASSVEITLPDIAVGAAAALEPFGFGWRGWREGQRDSYSEVLDRLAAAQDRASEWTPVHRLLGWAGFVQNDCLVAMVSRASRGRGRRDELIAKAADWRLLLQVDSDDRGALGYMFDDAGRLYFGLPADDLAAGRFDRVHAIADSA